MASLFQRKGLTDEEREKNNGHNHFVVLLVVAVFFIYIYLFTHAAQSVGLPLPEQLAEQSGVKIEHVFDADHNVDSNITISYTDRFGSNDDERLIFYLFGIGGFLLVYYLPVRFKQSTLAVWSIGMILILYGPEKTAGLVWSHLIVYLTLHPKKDSPLGWGAFAGLLWWAGFGGGNIFCLPLAVVGGLAIYRFILLPFIFSGRFTGVLRSCVTQFPTLSIMIGLLIETATGWSWEIPMGLFLAFWHWQRLILYHIDYKDGLVPAKLSFGRYLAVFFNPATIPSWNKESMIGQGYAYLDNLFLCKDKNSIALDGVKLMLLALLYLVAGRWCVYFLADIFASFHLNVFDASIRQMTRYFSTGGEIGAFSILMTTMLNLVKWTVFYVSITHFKVGIWRICGYWVDPDFNKPWLATNLVVFWRRYTFHYREFLVRAFYYPLFFGSFRRHLKTRIFVATMAAACFGNLIWGHMTERVLYKGVELGSFDYFLQAWPYFIFLGVGISVTELYLLKKKSRRKPWTWGAGIIGDVIAVYLTIQYYALIHIFIFPAGEVSVWDLFRLFFAGIGIRL